MSQIHQSQQQEQQEQQPRGGDVNIIIARDNNVVPPTTDPDLTTQAIQRRLCLAMRRFVPSRTEIQKIIREHPDVVKTPDNVYGRLPLHNALLYKNHIYCIKYILRKNPNATKRRTKRGRLPMHSASANRASLQTIQLLHEHNVDAVNTEDYDGWYPFHFAAAYGDSIEVLKFLMDTYKGDGDSGRQAALRQPDKYGWLPFHCAVRSGGQRASMNVIRWLLEQYPDAIRTGDKFGGLPLHCTVKNECTQELYELLTTTRQWDNNDNGQNLDIALSSSPCVWFGTKQIVDLLLEQYPDAASKPDMYGRLPLHRACSCYRKSSSESSADNDHPNNCLVMALIESYPQALMTPRKNGRLPLHDMVQYGAHKNLIQKMIDCYPQALTRPAFDGYLPLHCACISVVSSQQLVPVVDLLIEQNPAATQIASNDGSLPIHVACSRCLLFLVEKLAKAYPRGLVTEDRSGQLPLHRLCAVRGSTTTVVEQLVSAYPKTVDCEDKSGRTPLAIACENDESQLYTIMVLVAARVSLNGGMA